MDYVEGPKKFTVDLRRNSPRARKYVNKRGSMTSTGVEEQHYMIRLQHYIDCAIKTEQSVRLSQQEVEQMMSELNTTHNIWHIPAADIISTLKKWGKIQ